MTTLGMTYSACAACRRIVPARVESKGGRVFFRRFCPRHGESRSLVRGDAADYLRALRFVKPAWTPLLHGGDASAPCPEGCGLCDRHEQHLCMPIIEITGRCDLACPICIADAGGAGADMTPEQLAAILDRLIAAERQIDVLNLSGGEPTVHPRFLDLVAEAVSRPQIVRVTVSTNGLRLAEDAALRADLRRLGATVSLQFDGFDDAIYRTLRGRPMLAEKLRLIDLLGEEGGSMSLTFTAAAGVNDDQFPRLLALFFERPHVVSLMVQPLAFAGRAERWPGRSRRLTIPDVVRLIGAAGDPRVRADDFAPLPCSHPLCFSLAFFLLTGVPNPDGSGLGAPADSLMDALANRTVFGLDAGEQERLKELVYELWSGPAGACPDSEAVLRTLRGVLDELNAMARPAPGESDAGGCPCFDPRRAFRLAEQRIKSIFIHAFQDADTFDLARARRCCQAYPQVDGRLVPACVHNVLGGRGPRTVDGAT